MGYDKGETSVVLCIRSKISAILGQCETCKDILEKRERSLWVEEEGKAGLKEDEEC